MQKLWNQFKITKWSRSKFGRSDSLQIAIRANTEMAELLTALYNDKRAEVRGEAADVLIILFQVAEEEGFDLLEEVEKKMAINVTRRWAKTKSGDYQHV